jgi:hypothetical protein
MKTIILSLLLIFGLTTQNYSKPINDIYSIKDPVYTSDINGNGIPRSMKDITVASAPDSNDVRLNDEAGLNTNPFDSGVNSSNSLSHMKMKTLEDANISDLPINAEKIFYEKLSERLTEQSQKETGTSDIPAAYDNNFCCYEFNVPRSVSILINSSGKQTARQ